jgi:hypothetical protein
MSTDNNDAPATNQAEDEPNDTEGHGRGWAIADPEDVSGHTIKAHVTGEPDDTEGHAFSRGHHDENAGRGGKFPAAPEDDDAEGHTSGHRF